MWPKMKTLKGCARCGKCLPHCPAFKAVGAEPLSPRGRVALFQAGFVDQATGLNCLLCGSCEAVCPNEVPLLREILLERKRYRALYTQALAPFLEILRKRPKDWPEKNGEIALFVGCAEGLFYAPQLKRLLTQLEGVKVLTGAFCCGLPLLAAGEEEKFQALARKNLALFEEAPKILTFCASCLFTFKRLYPLFIEDEGVKESVQKVEEGVFYFLKQGFGLAPPEELFFQVPCHLKNLKLSPWWRGLDLSYYEGCCGQAGLYGFKFEQVSQRIAHPLKKAFFTSQAKLLATACSSCFFRLKKLFPHASVRPLFSYLRRQPPNKWDSP